MKTIISLTVLAANLGLGVAFDATQTAIRALRASEPHIAANESAAVNMTDPTLATFEPSPSPKAAPISPEADAPTSSPTYLSLTDLERQNFVLPHETQYMPQDVNISYAFQIKMFWEKGMKWQGRKESKQYCIECADKCQDYRRKCKSTSCKKGKQMMLNECEWDQKEQYWVYDQGKIMPMSNTDLCWTRHDKDKLRLEDCSPSELEDQTFTWFSEIDKFQIRPRHHHDYDRKEAMCLTQQHHPKSYELVEFYDCKEAESNDKDKYDDTSHWVIGSGYEGHSGKKNKVLRTPRGRRAPP